MKIVGINGFKRSGKGTTAEFLNELVDDVVYEIGFADKLKRLGGLALGIPANVPQDHLRWADEYKVSGTTSTVVPDGTYVVTGREFYQNLGQSGRVLFGDNFWIDQVLPYPALYWIDGEPYEDTDDPGIDAARMYPGVDILAITDVRYPNEAERIRSLGGVVWEVVRPGVVSDGHASEQPLPAELVDWQIVNDGDLDTLKQRVDEAIGETLR